MRILFVADGRSPIALNWMRHFTNSDHEVHLASTFPCRPDLQLESFHLAPVAFSGLKAEPAPGQSAASKRQGIWGAASVRLRTRLRQWVGPLTLPAAASRLRAIVNEVRPDLVHAMRIPYEGMLAAVANPVYPLLISVWGNDFTLHAPATPLMRRYTRLALQRAGAIHADCHRDIKLAHSWGLAQDKPTFVLPGAGGIQLDLFYPPQPHSLQTNGVDRDLTVINPRGFRAYVHNKTFFQAAALVLAIRPQARFVCPTMAGEAQVIRWIEDLGISEQVDLLTRQTRQQMADLFRGARLVVSPTSHDGTPNTVLEAMACGCFPIAGDIESLREWITPGVNGLLVDPDDPKALADAILAGFRDEALYRRALTHNTQLVARQADYKVVMRQAEIAYQDLISGKSAGLPASFSSSSN